MKGHMTLQNDRGAIDKYLREIGRIPLLTAKQEIELAKKVKQGDDDARTLMITSNLRLVVTVARSYENLGLPLLDLISEGNIGLVKAVERFELGKGAKLSSYAAWWIRQAIKRALDNQSRTIRVPVHQRDKQLKVRRLASRLSQELGREPTDEELAEEIGIDAHKLAQLNHESLAPASLDAQIGDEDLTEFGESVADEEAHTPFEALRDQDLAEKVSGLLAVLTERERKIVRARFGFDGDQRKTLGEIGASFGVTRERIRQLQIAAISKLRRALEKSETPVEFPLPLAA
jgi:RNA polymerase primary sigma factor